MNAHIIGWGKYLPEKVVTNDDLAQSAGVDAEWVSTRTGINTRHRADPKQASSDMGVRAAREALLVADLPASRLDLIICATNTPDHLFPATACLIQDGIGAHNAGAFDLASGCSGFLYALATGVQFIRAGAYRNLLILGVETTSRMLDWRDKNVCPFFGDGAGAVVVSASDQPGGLRAFTLRADGSGGELLIMPAGAARLPLSQAVLDQGLQFGKMDGRAVFRYGVRESVRNAHKVLRDAKMTLAEVDLYIPHQTNMTLINQVLEKLRFPLEKTALSVSRYANISSAAIPVTLCDAIEAGRVKPGTRLLFTAYGAGLASAGMIWQWSKTLPQKRMPFWRRFLHALWDAYAAFRARLFHLEHQLDQLTPTEEDKE
ncbi:MAG: ketoacyl-ACP synthase III [Chloroflexi bacterium]|nr:ketoacyl-ACP synthase III [Chloroflexota bacterium]